MTVRAYLRFQQSSRMTTLRGGQHQQLHSAMGKPPSDSLGHEEVKCDPLSVTVDERVS